MCAINGITKNDQALVERMNAVTKHRGPDGTRIYTDRNLVTLGFNRLAIIDLSEKAMQPMVDASGRYVMVFNGEIYNFKELRKELTEYPFQTEGDSETVLAAWNRWGIAACSKLNGMFAFAIWDKEEEVLTLARDASGIKPLYFTQEGGWLAFSSEMHALFETGMPRKLRRESLMNYLRLMYVPQPHTMLEGIQKVLPGHTLVYQKGDMLQEPFRGIWASTDIPSTYDDCRVLVKKTVSEAVSRQLVSDRPVGLYLSGGIDSTILLAAASEKHPAINTYSVGYELAPDEQSEKFNADQDLARDTAHHFGSTHHEFLFTSHDALSLFHDAIRHIDEPIGNATMLSQLFLARKAKDTATVVLTGDGGDELFGGYERYRLALLASKAKSLLPKAAASFLRLPTLHLDGAKRYAQLMFQKDLTLSRIVKGDLAGTERLFEEYFSHGDIVEALMDADEHTWLVDEALMRGDKMSMAASVESRVPFLDRDVAQLAHTLPRKYKVTFTTTKKILRDAFKKELPPAVLHAPKRGWFSPGAKWLRRKEFIEFADEVFSEAYVGDMGMHIDIGAVRTLWEEHRDKKAYHYTILFALLVFLVWSHEYKVSA